MQRFHISLLEQVLNIGSGFLVSMLLWIFYITPQYGFASDTGIAFEITCIYTVVSVIRGLAWRRLFNYFTFTFRTLRHE